jgi:opacity protein-like surface antigen
MEGSMKKQMFVLGASVLGLVLYAASPAAAGGPGEPVVEEPTAAPAPADVAAPPKEENADKPRGFYVGGSFGYDYWEGPSKGSRIFNDSTADANGDGQPDAFSVDSIGNQNTMTWSVFAGYRLADWLGAEVGWTDIGDFSATDLNDPSNASDPPHHNKVKARVDGVEARLKAWHPLGVDWLQGIGGIGIFIFSSHPPKFCYGPDTGGCTASPGHFGSVPAALDPTNDSGQALTLSAGLQFQVTPNILIRTEYQHMFEVLDEGVDMVTASVVFGFWDPMGQGKSGGGESFGGVTVE